MLTTQEVGERLLLAYRDLFGAEARLAEALARRGQRIGVPLAEQWATLEEYLDLYGRGLSPAGVLVLAGAVDEGSRATGIPFTGPEEARTRLGLAVSGEGSSPAAPAFWSAVDAATSQVQGASTEALFGSVHLAHALPFDFPPSPEGDAAGEAHVLRLLEETRPQVAVAVGADALRTLGRALHHHDVVSLSGTPESTWLDRWPPGTPPRALPQAEAPLKRPFRLRVMPVPALTGASAHTGTAALASLFSYLLG